MELNTGQLFNCSCISIDYQYSFWELRISLYSSPWHGADLVLLNSKYCCTVCLTPLIRDTKQNQWGFSIFRGYDKGRRWFANNACYSQGLVLGDRHTVIKTEKKGTWYEEVTSIRGIMILCINCGKNRLSPGGEGFWDYKNHGGNSNSTAPM